MANTSNLDPNLIIERHPSGTYTRTETIPYQTDDANGDGSLIYTRYHGGDEKVWIVKQTIDGTITRQEKTFQIWADRADGGNVWYPINQHLTIEEKQELGVI